MNPVWLSGNQSEIVIKWVSDQLDGCHRGFNGAVALAVLDGDSIAAAVVYHDWSPEYQVISMSAFADDARWLTRRVLWEMFDYPFNRAGCQMVYLQVSERNRRMLRIARRFGFDIIRS